MFKANLRFENNPSNWFGLVLFSNWLVNLTNHFKKSQIVPDFKWKCLKSFLVLSFFKVSLVRALKNVGSQFGRWNATISHFMKCLTPPFFFAHETTHSNLIAKENSLSECTCDHYPYFWEIKWNPEKAYLTIFHTFSPFGDFHDFCSHFWEKGNLLWFEKSTWDNNLGTKIQIHHCPHKYRCMNRYLEKITDCWDSFV